MAFSNEIMRQPVPNKPHIAKIEGFWRVSLYSKGQKLSDYHKAYYFTNKLNETLKLTPWVLEMHKKANFHDKLHTLRNYTGEI